MTRDHAAALAMLDKITPGPWAIENEGCIVNRAHDGDDWDIADVYGHNVNNIRAIAALPELAALYRASVELAEAKQALSAAEDCYRAAFKSGGDDDSVYTNKVFPAQVRLDKAWINFYAALAAVAAKLGEGK